MDFVRVYALMLFFILTNIFSTVQADVRGKSVDLFTITVVVPTAYGELKTEIHYDQKDYAVALRVKKIIETDLIKAVNYFEYVPENTVHFNLDPYMRLTNGNARVFPTDIINLYNFPPSGSEHLIVMEDWLRGLIFHEYIHISHLDQTDDWTELGRRIFGSIAKVPAGIVPRWFAEGIATWGESRLLIRSGRLDNPLFKKELLIQFLRTEYCKTIDCLDAPGVYPGGQLAYWAGSQFLEYVEDQTPGSIKCMVKKNAAKIPFLLNSVFFECTGKNAVNQFDDFKTYMDKGQPPITPESEAWGDKISNAFGSDVFQKGIFLDGTHLYKVEQERKSEALVSYDLEENVSMMTSQFSSPISDISDMTTMATEGDDESAKYLIISFTEDPHFRSENRVWKLVNAETLLEEATLPFYHDPSYVVGLGNNRFLTASFIDNRWIIERQRFDRENGKMFDPEMLHEFDSGTNLVMFKKKGQKIFLKVHVDDTGTLLVSDLSLEKFVNVYNSKDYFDLPVLTDSFLVTREKISGVNNYYLFEIDEAMTKVVSSVLLPELFNRVTSAEISDNRILVLENRLKTKAMTKDEALSYLRAGQKLVATSDLLPFTIEKKEMAKSDGSEESYPQWYHFKPHYWFIASSSSENISSIGATTMFSDPMDNTVINASVYTFPSISKVGGNLTFVHKFSSVTDLFNMNGFFDRDFSKSSISSVIRETKEGQLGFAYSVLLKKWTLIPGFYFAGKTSNDFLSDTSTKSVGLNNLTLYQSLSFDDIFQLFYSQVKVQLDDPDKGENFVNAKAKLQTVWRFYERLDLGVKTSWAKLFKTNFHQGVIYGGGSNNVSDQRWHEFYGVPYGDAYGNEIFTFRLYLDFNLWDIYRGKGFVPVFLKELHLIVGRETMYADRILLDKRLIREKAIHGFFAGPRLKVNLFYFVPADIDIIFSSVNNPNGGIVNDVQFNISADIF
jgi:hypothetical protein